MNIHIEVIPHKEQRYQTTGDWFWEKNGDLTIKISSVKNWQTETLVAIHEIIEAILCKKWNISEEDVSKFDIEHPELEDPGADERAPYHREHMFATSLEMLICHALGEDWDIHNDRMEALYPE